MKNKDEDFDINEQLETDEIELIKQLILLLIAHGIARISMGTLLRVLGHDPEECEAYDDEVYELRAESAGSSNSNNSKGKTIH
jgi:hypothetical protein